MVGAHIQSTPDEDLQYRRQEVRAGGKKLFTPVKTVDPAKNNPDARIGAKAEFANEMYAGLSKARLDKCILGNDASLSRQLNRTESLFRNKETAMQFCFLEFKTEQMPTREEIAFATDQAYVHSDITPIPMLSRFMDRLTNSVQGSKTARTPSEPKLQCFEKYLADAIETINQLNHKPIMGYVPDYRVFFSRLVKLYAKKGINTFYIDAHLSNPITLSPSLRALLRELNQQEILESSLIHMINPGTGRATNDSKSIPAKDILGFGLGIDSMGERHKALYPQAVADAGAAKPSNFQKLFDKDAYRYVKTSSPAEIKSFYPPDSEIDVSLFLGASDYKAQNAFNSEQIALESSRLRRRLAASRSMLGYVESKQDVQDADMKILKRAKIHDRK